MGRSSKVTVLEPERTKEGFCCWEEGGLLAMLVYVERVVDEVGMADVPVRWSAFRWPW